MNLEILKKFLITPIAIYAVIFLFISALIGAKIDAQAPWVYIVSLAIAIAGLYIGTNYVKPKNMQEGLKFGVVWLVILIVLDLILTLPFTGPEFFSSWHPYVSYVLTLLIPTALPVIKK
jgi:hypothetical protein